MAYIHIASPQGILIFAPLLNFSKLYTFFLLKTQVHIFLKSPENPLKLGLSCLVSTLSPHAPYPGTYHMPSLS